MQEARWTHCVYVTTPNVFAQWQSSLFWCCRRRCHSMHSLTPCVVLGVLHDVPPAQCALHMLHTAHCVLCTLHGPARSAH